MSGSTNETVTEWWRNATFNADEVLKEVFLLKKGNVTVHEKFIEVRE